MKQSISATKALSVVNRTLEVSPEWMPCLGGEIARHGTVFFWGNSGNGKSSAVMSFARMLASQGRVLYVSREEGYSLSFQNTLRRYQMDRIGAAFQVIDREDVESLSERLSRPKSQEFVIIDSLQVMGLSWKEYRALKERFPRKLFVLVSQTDGKQPDGRPARRMMFDADLKIWVEGHVAFSKGRFLGETGEYVIWPEAAERYWSGKL
jgi:hypothetical protein